MKVFFYFQLKLILLIKTMKNSNGLILYKGYSPINNKPIVVIATGLKAVTSNKKLGI